MPNPQFLANSWLVSVNTTSYITRKSFRSIQLKHKCPEEHSGAETQEEENRGDVTQTGRRVEENGAICLGRDILEKG